ncbi:MAG: anti-sigma factor [Cyclobacteriaceae bacterium]
MELINKEESNGDCREFERCLEILHLMLDNEASKAEEEYLNNHIEGCMTCFEQYEVEKQIRILLQTRLNHQQVPDDLASAIRSKVFE